MATYTPSKQLLPNGLDEIGFRFSMVRFPNETLGEFRERILLTMRDPLNPTFWQLTKAPGRAIGMYDKPMVLVEFEEDAPKPLLTISSTYLRIYTDADEEPDLIINLWDNNYYYLDDVITTVNAAGLPISMTPLEEGVMESRTLMATTSMRAYQTPASTDNYYTNLKRQCVRNLLFSDTTVFANPVLTPELVSNDGDYYVNEEEGIVHSKLPQSGQIYYEHFPRSFYLKTSPVIVYRHDDDIQDVMYNNVLVDSGEANGLLNEKGAELLNLILNSYGMEYK